MMDTCRSQSSSPDSTYDWDLQPSDDLREYFPYSSGPSSPSTITSEEVKWRIEYDRAVKKHRTDHPEFDHGYYIDINNIIRPTGWVSTSLLPSTRGLRLDKGPQYPPPTQAPPKDLQHEIRHIYEAQQDNWTANNSPKGLSQPMPLGNLTILYLMMGSQIQSKLMSSNIVKICILDSGTNRIVVNNESWLENTNSIPLTPTNTTIHGISGDVKASMQTTIGNSPILILPDMTDHFLSQGWSAHHDYI